MKFGSFVNTFAADNNNELEAKKRRHTRRESDRCVAVINGQTYPVFNWSVGGTLVNADERLFTPGDDIAITMKFKIGDKISDVKQSAKVIRKARGRIALQFKPLTGHSGRSMQHVLNDCVTNQFVESQMA